MMKELLPSIALVILAIAGLMGWYSRQKLELSVSKLQTAVVILINHTHIDDPCVIVKGGG